MYSSSKQIMKWDLIGSGVRCAFNPPLLHKAFPFFSLSLAGAAFCVCNSSVSCISLIHLCLLQGARRPRSCPRHSTAVKSWCVPYSSHRVRASVPTNASTWHLSAQPPASLAHKHTCSFQVENSPTEPRATITKP